MEQFVQETAAQIEELDEAERRAIKADAYRKVMHMAIFDDDQEAEFYEVEKEIQAFARERMRVFLGMDPDTRPSRAQEPVKVELPFTEQQIEVLSSWADGLIQRPQLLAAASAPSRGRPVEASPTAPQASPQPTPATVPQPARQATQEPGKRGRGRPPGTGKNQRAAAAAVKPETPAAPVQQPVVPDATLQSLQEQFPGVVPQVDPVTGQNYLMVERIIDGKTAFVRVNATDQTKPVGVQPKPWPSGLDPIQEGAVNRMNIAGDTNAQLNRELNGIIKQFQ